MIIKLIPLPVLLFLTGLIQGSGDAKANLLLVF